MSKDIGMGVRKGTVVSFVPTLFGCFLGPYMSFHFLKCFFVTCYVKHSISSAVLSWLLIFQLVLLSDLPLLCCLGGGGGGGGGGGFCQFPFLP